jgi:3-hydroxyacyl-CoA dehydrogenase
VQRKSFDLMKKIKKVPVKVLKEQSGYLLNTLQGVLRSTTYQLWAEGVASAEDIDLGIRASFGFRSPHEGSMMHADLGGSWRWPDDVVTQKTERTFAGMPGISRRSPRDILLVVAPWWGYLSSYIET